MTIAHQFDYQLCQMIWGHVRISGQPPMQCANKDGGHVLDDEIHRHFNVIFGDFQTVKNMGVLLVQNIGDFFAQDFH